MISRRSRATRRVSQTAGGMTSRDSRLSRQLSATIATAVPTAVVTLAATEVAVLVTTDCMAPMSLVRRDCTSPPRVRVKKSIDWRCRWSKTWVRRVCMICWPRPVDIQVCTTPSSELATVTREHAGDGEHEQAQVLVGERVVDDGPDEEGLGERDRRGGHDERHHDGDGPAVRAEQPGQTRERGTGDSASCWRSAREGFMALRPPRPPRPPDGFVSRCGCCPRDTTSFLCDCWSIEY